MCLTAEIALEDKTMLTASVPSGVTVHPDGDCVVDWQKVMEFGRVVKLTSRESADAPPCMTATVVRQATLQDQARARENGVLCRMAVKSLARRIDERHLPIRVVHARYTMDRSTFHATYAAEERVDCSDLGRVLGSELRMRVELRQIGVRDAARLAGGMGTCGRQLCCRSWLKGFDGVSVKMAKAQRMALNPGAIGGMCGRLKCCLRYEFEAYKAQQESEVAT
jgi:cell fate regulator YaaT (PSP1 superfamily)